MKTSPAMSIPAVIERTAMGIKPANGANYQEGRPGMDLDEVRTDDTRRRTRTYRKGCRRGLRTRPASDMEIADLEAIAAYVYARPPGEVKQEAAGVAVTLFALAEAHGFDLFSRPRKRSNALRICLQRSPSRNKLPRPPPESAGSRTLCVWSQRSRNRKICPGRWNIRPKAFLETLAKLQKASNPQCRRASFGQQSTARSSIMARWSRQVREGIERRRA